MKNIEVGTFAVSQKLRGLMFSFIIIGLLTFAIGIATDKERIWQSYLVNYFYFVSLALGGLFFTAIQYATKAGWSATVRRIFESLPSFLPVSVVLAVVYILFGSHHMYEWLNSDLVAKDEILTHKSAYLNMTAWVIRSVLFFGIWCIFRRIIVGNSLKQDETGDDNLTWKNLKFSIAFLILFAFSYSLFCVDFLMSLSPHWYSTMFGVYCFAGLFQSALAFICITTIQLLKKGLLKDVVTEEHVHELGKFLFAFTVFYAYIGFSQFMLIWYANIPAETVFFSARGHGGWLAISYSLLVFKFIVPFLLLLPRAAKRDYEHLSRVAGLLLVMQWVDDYWLIYPNFNDGHLIFSYQEVGLFLGFLGLFLYTVTAFLSKNKIVAVKDPYIEEALHHHAT